MNTPTTLAEVIRAMASGVPIDWDHISSTPADESVASILGQLRSISNIADVHGTARAGAASSDDSEARLESWGPLTVLERVGEGTYGQVYRAWDPRLDREVALKLLRPTASSVGTELPVFIEEGRLLARVRHPNVVAVYGADRIGGRAGIWMEFVDGRTLEQVVRDHGPLSAHEAAVIGIEILRGLSAVHRAGLLHRDIKAQNVMREAGGRVVLMDFGAGQHSAEARLDSLAGTPLYVAPEVLEGGAASMRSDLYSVGVLLYRLVANDFPFPGASLDAVRAAHRSGQSFLLRDRRPNLPVGFIQVVERAIDRDPDRRPRTAGEFERTLHALGEGAVAGTPIPRRVPIRVALLAAAVIVAVAATTRFLPLTDRVAFRSFFSGGTRIAPSTVRPAEGSMHKVTFPEALLIGTPSFEGAQFSYTDRDGDVAVFNLTSGESRKVTQKGDTSESAEFTVLSPDGRFVAYMWWTLDNTYELRIIGVDGKWPRLLLRRDDVAYPRPLEWSRDGSRLLIELQKPDGTDQLAIVRVADGALTAVASFTVESPRHASLSPDNRFVVFDIPPSSGAVERDVFISPAGGGSPHPLIAHPANDLNPVWSADGSSVIFMSDRAGAMGLWTARVHDGELEGEPVLTTRNLGLSEPVAVTSEGNYYFNFVAGTTDVFTSQVDLLGGVEASPPKRVASRFSGLNIDSGWSRDGRYLAYISIHGAVFFDRGSRALTIRDVESGVERSIRPDISLGFAPLRWSPDGSAILVRGKNRTNRHGWFIVDVASGRSRPAVLIDSPNNETDYGMADWAPDGRAVYFEHAGQGIVRRDLVTGVDEVLLTPPPPSRRFSRFALSPDGGSLAALVTVPATREQEAAFSLQVLVLGGVPREVLRISRPDRIMFQGWTPDGQNLLYTRIAMPKAADTLWLVPAAGGQPRSLRLAIEGLTGANPVVLRADGRTVAFTGGRLLIELWVLERLLSASGTAIR